MEFLKKYEEEIHACSRCGLCQAICPIYKITKNDCSVSKGLFIMLKGVLEEKIEFSKNINKYLNICLKCGACNNYCPSGLNALDIIIAAKNEYFKNSKFEQIKSFLSKILIYNFFLKIPKFFKIKQKSKKFEKRVIYFGGCSSNLIGSNHIIKILNKCNIEVVTPDFDCCGISFLVNGDFKSFENYKNKFLNKIKKYDINEIVTTCASCHKTLNDYKKYYPEDEFLQNLQIRNIFEYIKENNLILELKKKTKVTFHKPCHLNNFDNIEWILNHTKNLEYIKMDNYDVCCGLNALTTFANYKIIKTLLKNKRDNILKTKCKTVLTSCLGCEIALKTGSLFKYSVNDFLYFLNKNLK